MNIILYNNINPFSGIAPTPLVSQQNAFIKYGEQWGEVTHLKLNGQLTGFNIPSGIPPGCPPAYNPFFSGQVYLTQNFSKDFQPLQLIENNSVIFSKPYCIVRKISFPTSNYVGLLPFEIEIDCYESGFFSGVYGILEPKNEITFTQNKDQSITVLHSMSCRGFNTSASNSNALQNAINYISQISGFNGQVYPYFVQVCSGNTPSLVESEETINRVEGIYGVNETYILDPCFQSGVLRYTATFDSGIEDGIASVKIAGSLKSSRNYPMSFIVSRYNSFDIFSAAMDAYSGATQGLIDLNPLYLTSGVTSDHFAKTINFDILFNNDQVPNPFLDYKVEFKHDLITDITSADFQGTVKGRGDLNARYQRVLAFASGIDMYGLTVAEYQNDGYQYILNPYPISSGITKNPFVGEVVLHAAFDDKMLPVYGFSSFDYHVKVTPAIEKYSAIPILNGVGNYFVTDLGFTNRAILNINGEGVFLQGLSRASGINLLTNYINYIAQPYINGKNRVCLEGQNVSFGNDNIGNNLSFSVSWSYEDARLYI